MTLILGIDPGLTHTGWGIIRSEGNRLSFVEAGVITTSTHQTLAQRLAFHHIGLARVIAEHAPQEAAVEETFVNMNGASTLKLGQARGAILLTLSLNHLPVHEYATNLVKKTVTGSGHAEKSQVAQMVRMLLPGCRTMKTDATDALAVAIAHAQHRTVNTLAAIV